MNTTLRARPSFVIASAAMLVVFWGAHIVTREFSDQAPGTPARLWIVGLIIAAFAAFVASQARLALSLDEYHRQIQFLALSIAYPISIVVMFAIGFARGEGLLSGADPRDLWMAALVPYVAGLAIAMWKYR
jgi:hypothetical protein